MGFGCNWGRKFGKVTFYTVMDKEKQINVVMKAYAISIKAFEEQFLRSHFVKLGHLRARKAHAFT